MAGAIPVQTQEDIVPPPPKPIGYRWSGVLLAPAVAVTTHVVLSGPFGLGLATPSSPGSSEVEPLDLLTTTVVTLAVSLMAWVAVVLLERMAGKERGRTIWMWVAFGVYVLSIPPIAALEVSTGAQWGLLALHTTVALVLIPAMTARGEPDPAA